MRQDSCGYVTPASDRGAPEGSQSGPRVTRHRLRNSRAAIPAKLRQDVTKGQRGRLLGSFEELVVFLLFVVRQKDLFDFL